MKAKQFNGWKRVGPRALLRGTDRWSFFPHTYPSPATMFTVLESLTLQVGGRIPPRRELAKPITVYRRIET